MREITDPLIVAGILRSEVFRVRDFGSDNRVLSERFGIDLEALLRFYRHTPLFVNGDEHKALRSRMLSKLVARRARHLELIDANKYRVSDVFSQPGEVDAISDFLVPYYNEIWQDDISLDEETQLRMRSFSELLDPRAAIRTRKEVNEIFGEVISNAKDASDDWLELLVMYFMGRMALVGSFALSLWHIWASHKHVPQSQISWPSDMPHTSVFAVDRIANQDTDVAGCPFSDNEFIRCFLDPTVTGHKPDRMVNLFGAGKRLCLGRPLTLAIWRAITTELAKLNVAIRPDQSKPPSIRNPIDAPQSMMVHVSKV